MTVLRPARGELLAALTCVIVSTASSLVPLIGVVEIARLVIADGPLDSRRVWWVVAAIGGGLVVRVTFMMAGGWLSHHADIRLASALKRQLVTKLGRLPLGYFTRASSGAVKKAVNDDVQTLHHLVAHAVLEVTGAITVPVVILAYLIVVDWVMALITVVPLVLGAVGYALAMRGSEQMFMRYDAATRELGASTVEFVNGISVVKAFGRVGVAHRQFNSAADEFSTFYSTWMRMSQRGMLIMELATSPVTTLVTVGVAGLALTQAGQLTLPDLVAFLVLGLGITAPITVLGYSAQALREASQAARRVLDFVDEPELPLAHEAPALVGEQPTVTLDNVGFRYQSTAPRALAEVNLTLRPGTVTAIVGPSGSGKSTLAALLARFGDPETGAVRIDGIDVRELPESVLYQKVSLVFQDPLLQRTTVRDNIRLARPDADDAEVRAAADTAQLGTRIAEMPAGLDTVVGTDLRLSGGEAQRVAIARAVMADTPILVLDEATASADPESEAQIQQALTGLLRGKTVVVIAHRLSTIRHADQIVVLDHGRIAEIGTHDELVDTGGAYAALWEDEQRQERQGNRG
ncbi:ABC transporter ATP-binding protein [Gordonia sp. i37]|uniref:ABC transporter ATP-binding protein n=1 Tax=Gordonia sp. i37 TaxID=1961707 RepID=UPI001555447C|nr:ABC transporter ATP-binding protein [Gordonia sp. i37]